MEPEILVFDEPTAGLDPKGRDTIFSMIKNYREKTGKTVIIVSHSMEDIAKIATRVLVMNKGTVAMFDKAENIFSKSSQLLEMGLNVPQITRVFMSLKEKGYDVDSSVYTVKQAVNEILNLRGEKI